ncbi:hypothetical protein IY145_18820 [Methylosinus sp. H3A]|uniref:hypothetical protein n=1 Tax=Methylosinus sp. H3A TaxID=2785786 RepID=UPI0018C2155F|nr:hypothetical protein [Methylosinus sp. H3A]MBG0811407.1 hypothetical protein [Methylosinus sp. H3A]
MWSFRPLAAAVFLLASTEAAWTKSNGLNVREIDFDKLKNVVKSFVVANRSAPIVSNNGRAGGIAGTTDPEKIADRHEKTL